ncbi:Hypothetical protein HEAR0507 [Herminiimonas arsenicoxydans]|uniref:Uncharacterized protein n=1 Tax=Herminiimonas arsenicoxydans TaxID=204773 RepID=A4G2I0_HERAR|nr:Hypothetical protein HEAR0507 [Herminiimonas arsenicoxydans]
MNALYLDQLLNGDTAVVLKIMKGDIGEDELGKLLAVAESEVARRAEIYTYWQQRMSAVQSVLKPGLIDYKKQSLESVIGQCQQAIPIKKVDTFALRAVRQLERIEQRGRLSGPSADELVEQADAYLALNDLVRAQAKAKAAVEIEKHHPRAWFIRVIVALKQRNSAHGKMRHYQIEATEIAEVISAHESMAHHLADEFAIEASERQEALDQLVPDALLHWPTRGRGQFDHPEWRAVVRDLLLAQVFRKVVLGGELYYSQMAFSLNGFEPEWHLKYDSVELFRSYDFVTDEDLPLSAVECKALRLLFEEHARYRSTFFGFENTDMLARDFQLLHLRWILRDAGYTQHWENWSQDVASYPSTSFELSILRNAVLGPLWVSHQARNGGTSSIFQILSRWQDCASKRRREQINERVLASLLIVCHHQLARSDFAGCWQTCSEAERLVDGKNNFGFGFAHPMEPMIMIPAKNARYWHYVKALTVVKAKYSGIVLDDEMTDMFNNAEYWRQEFSDQKTCFWNCSEEFEDGGGEEYLVAPYDIDLTDISNWEVPTRGRDIPFDNFSVSMPESVGKLSSS